MKLIYGILAVLVVAVSMVIWAFRRGQDRQENKQSKAALDNVSKDKKTREKLRHDPDFRKRVRDYFVRKNGNK